MLIVPVTGDKITVKDTEEVLVVSSYTNLKKEPALYIEGNSADAVIFFSQIEEINGVKVSYNSTSKVFDSLGPLKRKINLPQIGDLLSVEDGKEIKEIEVKNLKLHDRNKKSFGLLVSDGIDTYSLKQIKEISSKSNLSNPNIVQFRKYYIDYFPLV